MPEPCLHSSDVNSYGTQNSDSTKATTVYSENEMGNGQFGQPALNNAYGVLHQTTDVEVSPSDPLTTAAIGAQFANQFQRTPPAPSLEEEQNLRQARMAVLHEAFLDLDVDIPHIVLVQVEEAGYSIGIPQTVQEQLATQLPQEDYMVRWVRAEEIWNIITRRIRATSPVLGTLLGWEEQEQLPYTGLG